MNVFPVGTFVGLAGEIKGHFLISFAVPIFFF